MENVDCPRAQQQFALHVHMNFSRNVEFAQKQLVRIKRACIPLDYWEDELHVTVTKINNIYKVTLENIHKMEQKGIGFCLQYSLAFGLSVSSREAIVRSVQ